MIRFGCGGILMGRLSDRFGIIVPVAAGAIVLGMPQVHIVAYPGDLGHGAARGAQMLSPMLGFGVVSRLASGSSLPGRPACASAPC